MGYNRYIAEREETTEIVEDNLFEDVVEDNFFEEVVEDSLNEESLCVRLSDSRWLPLSLESLLSLYLSY